VTFQVYAQNKLKRAPFETAVDGLYSYGHGIVGSSSMAITKMRKLAILLLLLHTTTLLQAFAPNVSKNTLGKRNVLVNNALRIRAVNKDDKEDDQLNSPSNNNRSLSRVGGRRKKKMVKENTSKRKEAFVPLISGLLGFILLSRVFAPSNSNPNFVYYSSSVYESSRYDSQTGQIVTNRKEDFKSNIPGLKGQFMETPGMISFGSSISDKELLNSLDDLDYQIEKEMIQMFNDMWK